MKKVTKKDQEQINTMLHTLGDEEAKEETQKNVIDDPISTLKTVTANFLTQRFNKISEDDETERQLTKSLLEKLGDASFSDIKGALSMFKTRNTESVQAILEFFKPTQGDTNPILGNPRDKEEGIAQKVYNEADYQLMQNLQTIINVLDHVRKNKESEEKKGE